METIQQVLPVFSEALKKTSTASGRRERRNQVLGSLTSSYGDDATETARSRRRKRDVLRDAITSSTRRTSLVEGKKGAPVDVPAASLSLRRSSRASVAGRGGSHSGGKKKPSPSSVLAAKPERMLSKKPRKVARANSQEEKAPKKKAKGSSSALFGSSSLSSSTTPQLEDKKSTDSGSKRRESRRGSSEPQSASAGLGEALVSAVKSERKDSLGRQAAAPVPTAPAAASPPAPHPAPAGGAPPPPIAASSPPPAPPAARDGATPLLASPELLDDADEVFLESSSMYYGSEIPSQMTRTASTSSDAPYQEDLNSLSLEFAQPVEREKAGARPSKATSVKDKKKVVKEGKKYKKQKVRAATKEKEREEQKRKEKEERDKVRESKEREKLNKRARKDQGVKHDKMMEVQEPLFSKGAMPASEGYLDDSFVSASDYSLSADQKTPDEAAGYTFAEADDDEAGESMDYIEEEELPSSDASDDDERAKSESSGVGLEDALAANDDALFVPPRSSLYYLDEEEESKEATDEDDEPAGYIEEETVVSRPEASKLSLSRLSKKLGSLALRKKRGQMNEGVPADTPKDKKKEKAQSVQYAWNDRFQQCVADLHTKDSLHAYERLAELAQDFAYTAETYGRMIITEVAMPVEMKTVKPINLGGVVGGDKYICHGVLFKFAIDSSKILQSDATAMKIAGHELKSLDCLFSCDINGLFYPLLALVDYRGYRLIALSTLPVGRDTLVFGSCDGGKSMRSGVNLQLEEYLQRACEELNLKPHYVGPGLKGTRHEGDGYDSSGRALSYGPIDLEGHVGTDGRFYLLDFSRLFPPSKLDRSVRCSHLFQLLRPELVRRYNAPLCSDGYSRFVYHQSDAKEHKKEIVGATKYLTDNVLPEFAKLLAKQKTNTLPLGPAVLCLHRQGINIRYIGLLRSCLLDTCWSQMFLVEMIARVSKWEIRRRMREASTGSTMPMDLPFKMAVVTYCNVLFGTSPESVAYWACELRQQVAQKFVGAFTEEEQATPGALRALVYDAQNEDGVPYICLLFRRISEIMGIKFSSEAVSSFSTNPMAFDSAAPFDVTQIEALRPVVKHLNLLEHSQAAVVKAKAYEIRSRISRLSDSKFGELEECSTRQVDEQAYLRLVRLAINRFERALRCNPSNKDTLRSLADLLSNTPQIPFSCEQAQVYYQLALDADIDDPRTTFAYARYCHRWGKNYDEADEYYLRTIEENPAHKEAHGWYAALLQWDFGDEDAAEEFFVRGEHLSTLAAEQGLYEDSGVFYVLYALHVYCKQRREAAIELFNAARGAGVTREQAHEVLHEIYSRCERKEIADFFEECVQNA